MPPSAEEGLEDYNMILRYMATKKLKKSTTDVAAVMVLANFYANPSSLIRASKRLWIARSSIQRILRNNNFHDFIIFGS